MLCFSIQSLGAFVSAYCVNNAQEIVKTAEALCSIGQSSYRRNQQLLNQTVQCGGQALARLSSVSAH